jgi:actin-like ATPase involved in cell morphogenesis
MAIGLDIGTCYIVCAIQKKNSSDIEIKSIRNVFLDIEADPPVLNMLKMSNISYIQEKDNVYIIGEPALNIANLLKKEVKRPLSQGVISAGEREAEKMLAILLKKVIGEPNYEDEMVYYSIPAKAIDKEMDVIYHESMFKKIIESFGFKAQPMNEASAIVYSNCAAEGFTALASSFGAGMVNTALVYQTMIGMSFSVSRGGDYIDSSAARAVGSTSTKLMSIKERGIDLLNPEVGDPKQIREREALVIYYKNLIHYVIENIKKEFKKSDSKIELPESIPWIISGGTTKAINFLEFFKKEFEKERDNFPINISEIRMAKDVLNDVAKGLLIAALS